MRELDPAKRKDLVEACRAIVARVRAVGGRREDASREICELLFFGHGIPPNAAMLLKLSGWGSNSDLPRDVEAFWARIQAAATPVTTSQALSASLKARLNAFANELLTEVVAESEAEITARVAKVTDEANLEMRNQRAHYDALVLQLEQEASALRERLTVLEATLVEREASIDELKSQCAALRDQLVSLGRVADAERNTSAMLREALSHEQAERQRERLEAAVTLDKERELHQRAIDVLEGQITFVTLQVDNARDVSRQYEAQVKSLNAELALVNARAAQAAAESRQRESKLEGDLGEARGRLASISLELQSAQSRIAELEQDLRSSSAALLSDSQLRAARAEFRLKIAAHSALSAWAKDREAQIDVDLSVSPPRFRLCPADGDPTPYCLTIAELVDHLSLNDD